MYYLSTYSNPVLCYSIRLPISISSDREATMRLCHVDLDVAFGLSNLDENVDVARPTAH